MKIVINYLSVLRWIFSHNGSIGNFIGGVGVAYWILTILNKNLKAQWKSIPADDITHKIESISNYLQIEIALDIEKTKKLITEIEQPLVLNESQKHTVVGLYLIDHDTILKLLFSTIAIVKNIKYAHEISSNYSEYLENISKYIKNSGVDELLKSILTKLKHKANPEVLITKELEKFYKSVDYIVNTIK